MIKNKTLYFENVFKNIKNIKSFASKINIKDM